MPIDRKTIGGRSQSSVVEVEKGRLRAFAEAAGETDPIYFNEAAAFAAGHPALPAPPGFAHSLTLATPARRGDLFADIGIDVLRALHGQRRSPDYAPIYAGDQITLTTVTSDISEQKDGAVELVLQDTQAVNQRGEICVEARAVLVVRKPMSPQPFRRGGSTSPKSRDFGQACLRRQTMRKS